MLRSGSASEISCGRSPICSIRRPSGRCSAVKVQRTANSAGSRTTGTRPGHDRGHEAEGRDEKSGGRRTDRGEHDVSRANGLCDMGTRERDRAMHDGPRCRKVADFLQSIVVETAENAINRKGHPEIIMVTLWPSRDLLLHLHQPERSRPGSRREQSHSLALDRSRRLSRACRHSRHGPQADRPQGT